MGAQALAMPGGGGGQAPDQGQGPGPGGGFPSPAPAQPDQGAAQMLEAVRTIVSAARMIGMKVPGAIQEVRAINDAVARMQQKIIQSQPGAEPQAPPV
jgi:hypothetical protein